MRRITRARRVGLVLEYTVLDNGAPISGSVPWSRDVAAMRVAIRQAVDAQTEENVPGLIGDLDA